MYDYGLIGNCQISALINSNASIDWLCLPRPDGPPVFGKLLDPQGGHFSIELENHIHSIQSYIPNTNVLETILTAKDGSEIKVTDFCPRFEQYGRIYRPTSLFRIIEPLKGHPRIKVEFVPITGWDKNYAHPLRGNSHLHFEIRNEHLKITTNMSLTYLLEKICFPLKDKIIMALTWSSTGIDADLSDVANQFLNKTIDYWKNWVRTCSIPTLYQKETIRSALTLKLHCFEDTGAILAGLTTGLPEEIGGPRNWDYRYCWPRDAYFVLTAFNNLGHFDETEKFMTFLLGIAENVERIDMGLDGHLTRAAIHPVYKLDQSLPLPEHEHANWAGYKNSIPVRSGNLAADHVQNDVYGEMILTLAPIFFDERLVHLRTDRQEDLLLRLGKECSKRLSAPDAGIWEIRNNRQIHSFSNLLNWAGLDRLSKIAERGHLKNTSFNITQALTKAEAALNAAIVDGVLMNGPHDHSADSGLLLLPILRYPNKDVVSKTVERVMTDLQFKKGDQNYPHFLFRYKRPDDFGTPNSAFVICSFWLVQALSFLNRKEEAKIFMDGLLQSSNRLGLFSEHFDPLTKMQLGNFPQAYSHVGLINAAFSISPSWVDLI